MRRTILAVCQFLCRKGQKEKSSLTPTREHLEAVAEVDTRNRNAVPPPAGPSSLLFSVPREPHGAPRLPTRSYSRRRRVSAPRGDTAIRFGTGRNDRTVRNGMGWTAAREKAGTQTTKHTRRASGGQTAQFVYTLPEDWNGEQKQSSVAQKQVYT